MVFLKKCFTKIGLDPAIFYTFSSNVVNLIGSILSLVLVVKYLSIHEQGFYYTFGSIAAIQIFFELGLNGIITQYAAHENAHLSVNENQELVGPAFHQSRLCSLLHFSFKWYSICSALLLLFLFPVGVFFFKNYDDPSQNISWLFPWLLLVFATSLNLFLSPVIAFLQGLGMVRDIAKIQFRLQILRILVVSLALLCGSKLYVLGLGSLVFFIFFFLAIYLNYRRLFLYIWNVKIVSAISFRGEIFPYQWKIAVSWISGYFIFQLFNPVIFAAEGASEAGKMGMTLSALNAVFAISYAWISTKIPFFSTLVARNDYQLLDFEFNRVFKQSLLIIIFLLTLLLLLVTLFREFNLFFLGSIVRERLLGIVPLVFLSLQLVLNHVVSSWAAYLRCHKKEPFLLNSVVGAVLCSFTIIYFGNKYGVIGVTAGYFILSLLMFPWAFYIFIRKKRSWHSESN